MFLLRNSPRALAVAGIVVTLISCLCGFALFFPAESLRPRLEAEGAKRGLRLTIKDLATTFPFGLALQGVGINGNGPESGGVKVERLTLNPAWSRLLLGQVAFDYDAALLGGRISGVMQRPGPLTLQGNGLSWQGVLPGLSGGTLVAEGCGGELSAFAPAAASDPLLLALDCEAVRVEGLLGAKVPLLLGRLTVKGSGKGKDLRLTTLAASGGQLDIAGNGTLLVNAPLGRSLLNLNLTLRGNAALDPTLAELLAAFLPPASDGTSRLRLTGTLDSPQKGP